MLALVTPLLWPSSSVLYTELAPQQSTTTARTSCSTVLQSSEGPARSTAELAVVAVVVGTKAPLSAIHRRSFPSLKAGYTVDAHIEALVNEGDVASSFVPGHCSRRQAPRTAKYISLHLSYRQPGVQPSPSLSEIVLDFGTCEVMNNMQYVIWRYDSPAMGVLDADEAELICAAQIADFLSLSLREWLRHRG